MQNCAASYIVSCALGESHMIHIAEGEQPVGTLEVRKEITGKTPRSFSSTHRDTIMSRYPIRPSKQSWTPATRVAFLSTPEALLPRSTRADFLAPMMQTQCSDYPTWVCSDLGFHYFDLHVHVTGADLIHRYRAALEVHIGANGNLYQLALRAVQQCRTLTSEVRNYLDAVVNVY